MPRAHGALALALCLAACSGAPHTVLNVPAGEELVCTTRPLHAAPPPRVAATPPPREPPPPADAGVHAATTPPPPAPAPSPAPNVTPARMVLLAATSRDWELARVARCEGARAVLVQRDGSPRTVLRTLIRTPVLLPGMQVMARWGEGEGTPYHAVVRSTQGRSVHVRYDDDSEEDVDLTRIDSVSSSTLPGIVAQSCPPPPGMLPMVLTERRPWRDFGAVIECGGPMVLIERRQGQRVSVATSRLTQVTLAEGDRVLVRWRDGADYNARVDRVEGASLAVTYDDGSEETVTLGQVVAWNEPLNAATRVRPFRCAP